eukprot:TRINITY_DN20546_c0_g1_i1.p1 TRINITY_DN20546_c0_g1~~TRINITY_DN20546_c0_g1_i1.p1  ORF type:complete len:478 (+),score=45.72 TRINITY_DN20546_c0_g1_i1:60-1493(+)
MLRNKVTACVLIVLLLTPYMAPVMWTDWRRLEHLQKQVAVLEEKPPPKVTTNTPCSYMNPSIRHTVVNWPRLIPCGDTVEITYSLRDEKGVSLCHNTPMLFGFARSSPQEWVATSTVGVHTNAIKIAFPATSNNTTVTITILLAFTNITLSRGNPNSSECTYTTIDTKSYPYTCTPNTTSKQPSPSLQHYWKYSGDPNAKWLLRRLLPTRAPPAPTSDWIMFWGDGQLQVTFRNIIRTLTAGKVNPFPGDRKSKMYIAREISHELRKYNIDVVGSRMSYFANHITEPSGTKSKNPCKGLASLDDVGYKDRLTNFVTEGNTSYRKVLVLHSGIADLCNSYDINTTLLRNRARQAALFWNTTFQPTHVVLLSTVATSGIGVCHRFHAARTMWWDGVRIEEMKRVFPNAVLFDQFSLTVPFHLNNDFSDGTSYGIENVKGKREVQLHNFPKISKFLAGKRYDPSVGIALGDELMNVIKHL